MTKPVILTGIRANNDLTLGNYFGAMLPIIDMAKKHSDEYQVNMFIPDLHSFTTPIDHTKLHESIVQTARVFAAAGLPLDNDDIHVYRQSYVPAHSELTWILDCFTSFGQMRRMTQFKEKAGASNILRNAVRATEAYETEMENLRASPSIDVSNEIQAKLLKNMATAIDLIADAEEKMGGVSIGLFNYPVLMAADILLYGAQYVPVGDDQTQHLEFARDISERMNKKFSTDLFIIPEPVKKQHAFFGNDQGLRVMDLADPSKKMSKSDDSGKGVIFLSDTPEVGAKKVMSATTDDKALIQLDYKQQPGISNLLQISALLSGEPVEAVLFRQHVKTNYGEFKREVSEQVKAFLTEFQSKLAAVDSAVVLEKLSSSEIRMNTQANKRLHTVQQAIGLRPQS